MMEVFSIQESVAMREYPTDENGRIWLNRKEVLKKASSYWKIRRFQDVVLSAAALVILFPLMVLIAVVIMLDSPGNPIFVQERCGRDGKLFKMLKFRSMYIDAEERLKELQQVNEMDGPAFKIKEDPRITRVGRFIRKTSLDELPQLWNVLCGYMSIVGPRPPLLREVEQYDDYQSQRLYVTPGMTCYWQVQTDRYHMSFDDWVDLDLKYIYDRSFLTDWKIIFLTVRVMVLGHGE